MKNYAIEIIDANLKQLKGIHANHKIILRSKAIGVAAKNKRLKEFDMVEKRISQLKRAKEIITAELRINTKRYTKVSEEEEDYEDESNLSPYGGEIPKDINMIDHRINGY